MAKITVELSDNELDTIIEALEEKEACAPEDDIFLVEIINKFKRAIKGGVK